MNSTPNRIIKRLQNLPVDLIVFSLKQKYLISMGDILVTSMCKGKQKLSAHCSIAIQLLLLIQFFLHASSAVPRDHNQLIYQFLVSTCIGFGG